MQSATMKLLLLYLEIICVCVSKYSAYPTVRTWTIHELRLAIQAEDPILTSNESVRVPVLHAFGQMMSTLFTGEPEVFVGILLSPSGDKKWTREQLEKVINDEKTDIYLTPFIAQAYVGLINNKMKIHDTEVRVIALDISTWTKKDVQKAMEDKSINPDLIPYLNEAQQEFQYLEIEKKTIEKKKKNGRRNGKIKEPVSNVTIVTPVGLIPPPEGVRPVIVPKTLED